MMKRFTHSFMKRAYVLMALRAAFAVSCSDDNDPQPKGTPWTIKMTAQIEEARTIEFVLDKENPVTIDWGDGSEVNALNWHHDYQPGTYNLTLTGEGGIGIVCNACDLTAIDVSQCPDLKKLYCSQNALTRLDVSACPELNALACGLNNISELDLSQCPQLDTLVCDDNQLTRLDITRNPKLKGLSCANNQLTSLDITQCPDLEIFMISGNPFSKEALQAIIDALPDRRKLGSGTLILEENSEADLSGLKTKNWNVIFRDSASKE